jgi:hypothetical protein
MVKNEVDIKEKGRFCGNCRYHNAYNYPDQNFCFLKFQNRENPVVSALDYCPEWLFKPQECFCLDELVRKKKKIK